MSNVWVTGGEGFLGLNLIKRLVIEGHHVVSFDNRSTSDPGARLLITADEPRMTDVVWIPGDVADIENCWRGDTQEYSTVPDAIFHLACPASPPRYQRDPIATLRTCFEGSLAVFRLAASLGQIPVVLASTSEVYGERHGIMSEDDMSNVRCNGIRSCYDVGKMAGEALAREFPCVRVARIFNAYGPYMYPDDGRMIPNFVCQLLRRHALTIYGGGQQTRSLAYVDDTIDGLMRLWRFQPGPDGDRTFNIGSETERTVTDVAELVRHVGVSMGHAYVDVNSRHAMPEDDPPARRPSTRLAQLRLGWEPRIGINQGLAKTIAYFERRLGLGMSSPRAIVDAC